MNLFNNSNDWLGLVTSRDNSYWVARVQSLIVQHSTIEEGQLHGTTDTGKVLRELVREVLDTAVVPHPEAGVPIYDENMYAFAVVAQITALWYSRVHLAKISDPRRPVGNAMKRYREAYLPWLMGMQLTLADISRDPSYFQGQKWQHPFDPNAESGGFL